jgi:hypothetical protein
MKKTFSLSDYNDQKVYVAIQCVSDNAFVFMIDDLEVKTASDTAALPSSLFLDFESLNDFTLDFDPWTVKDVNGGFTYVINNCVFPHNGEPMAFINFNPSKAIPPPAHMSAHSGSKFGACFSSEPPNNPNNKWLISPQMLPGNNAKIAFWVESYNITYGYEKFNVGVSVTGNEPSDFTIISGAKPDSAPINWTRKIYSLGDYENKPVYIGIQCVTDNGFCFMIDDIEIGSSVYLDDDKDAGTVNIFPNPAVNNLTIDFGQLTSDDAVIEIFNVNGEIILRKEIRDNKKRTFLTDISGLAPGLYLVKINSSGASVSKKILVER